MVKDPVPPPNMERVREVFVRERATRHQTFETLAEETGLSRQTLLNISSGKYNGDLRTWLILSRAWGLSLDELLATVWED